MRKQDLMKLALIGMTAGLCVQGYAADSPQTGAQPTVKSTTPMTAQERAFYNQLNPEAKSIFEQMTPEARQHAMNLAYGQTSQNETPPASSCKGKKPDNSQTNTSMNDDTSAPAGSPSSSSGKSDSKGMPPNDAVKKANQSTTPPAAGGMTAPGNTSWNDSQRNDEMAANMDGAAAAPKSGSKKQKQKAQTKSPKNQPLPNSGAGPIENRPLPNSGAGPIENRPLPNSGS